MFVSRFKVFVFFIASSRGDLSDSILYADLSLVKQLLLYIANPYVIFSKHQTVGLDIYIGEQPR